MYFDILLLQNTSLVKFRCMKEGGGKERWDGGARERGKRSEDVLHVAGCWERHAPRDRRKWLQSEERDGKRSSLGNLFWSSQSTDTQGAGKPITV